MGDFPRFIQENAVPETGSTQPMGGNALPLSCPWSMAISVLYRGDLRLPVFGKEIIQGLG